MDFNEGLFTEDLAGIGDPTRDRSVQGPAITTPFPSRDLLVRVIATVGRGAAQQEQQPYLKTQLLPKSASNREGVEEETMNTWHSPWPSISFWSLPLAECNRKPTDQGAQAKPYIESNSWGTEEGREWVGEVSQSWWERRRLTSSKSKHLFVKCLCPINY